MEFYEAFTEIELYPLIVLAICMVLSGLVIGALCGHGDWPWKDKEPHE